jgi:UDPglucose--hexose-1-phosphate uridylyltransferase
MLYDASIGGVEREASMSELRQDPVTGGWTIVAPERGGRPRDYGFEHEELGSAEGCPLCAGNEHMTPPTRAEGRLPGSDAWVTRVVENKFPALSAPDDAFGAEPIDAPPPYKATTGFGAHEVIVETPRHGEGLADYAPEHARLVVDTFSERLAHWRVDGRVMHTLLFRNWGRGAGASLAHAHTQLAALPRVPDAVITEMGNFSGYFTEHSRCVLCDAIEADDREGRTVLEHDGVVVQSPWAAPTPYALRLAPRRCADTFVGAPDEELDGFAAALVTAAGVLEGRLGSPPLNIAFHVAPYRVSDVAVLPFHWHAEIVPRLSERAAFEMGSGAHINVVDPGAAAADLRSVADGLESGT